MGTFLVTLARLAKASLTRVRSGREGPILPPLPSEIHLVRGQVSASLSLFLGVYLHYLTPQTGLPPSSHHPTSPSHAGRAQLPQQDQAPAMPAGRDSPGRILHPSRYHWGGWGRDLLRLPHGEVETTSLPCVEPQTPPTAHNAFFI